MGMQAKQERIANARGTVIAKTSARDRLGMLFDPDTFVELDTFVGVQKGGAGVICGFGAVMGGPVYAFIQDGGPVGLAQATKLRKLYDMALKTGAPIIGIYDSDGLKLEESVCALAAYGEMLRMCSNLSGVVPQISLVLGSCVGASAMMACATDFLIMSESAEFYATPPNAGTPSGSGTAGAASKSGVAHIIAKDDAEAVAAVRKLISYLPINNLASLPISVFTEPPVLAQADETTPAEEVLTGLIDLESEIELLPQFGNGVCGAMATIGGYPCGVIATRGEALSADDCAKIARLVSVWDSYHIPVITLVNTPGMKTGEGVCAGGARDMAKVAHVYAEATTPKVTVITGMAYGSAYIALANRHSCADYALAWPSAVISPLSPELAVAFLKADEISKETSREQLETDYINVEASPLNAAANGHIDDIVEPSITRPAIIASLDLLSAKRVYKNPKKHGNIPF